MSGVARRGGAARAAVQLGGEGGGAVAYAGDGLRLGAARSSSTSAACGNRSTAGVSPLIRPQSAMTSAGACGESAS